MDKQEVIAFGVTSAREAFDQVADYAGIDSAIDAYRQNVRDTLSEHNAVKYVAEAVEAFELEVGKLRAKLEATEFKVQYQKLAELETIGANKFHVATFDNLEDAQLWYDSILFLRNIYMINGYRPR